VPKGRAGVQKTGRSFALLPVGLKKEKSYGTIAGTSLE